MKNATEIVVVADRSTSMTGIITEMLAGYNGFIEEQKKDTTPANVTLVTFDDVSEIIYAGTPLAEVPALTREQYFPRGCTALLDAVGDAITETGKRLSEMKEEDRPNKVIVMIMTDGQENRSRRFSGEKIKEMIKHQREVYKWQFLFLGVDIDAYEMGNQFGIAADNILSSAKADMGDVYRAVGQSYTASRGMEGTLSMDHLGFTPNMKKMAKDKGVKPAGK
jgi:uncharacterized protein YegL